VGSRRPHLLVVGHDASRSGAPIQARTLLRWLAATETADIATLLLAPGPLVDDFAALGPTRVTPLAPLLARPAVTRLSTSRWLGSAGAAVGRLHQGPADLVLANTLAALPAAVAVRGSRPVACWVHELDGVADRVLDADARHRLVGSVDRWVTAGARVAEMLVSRWGIDANRVQALQPFLEAMPAAAYPPAGTGRAPRVLGVGSMVPRKGVDAFVATMAVLARHHPEVQSTWVGGDLGTAYATQIRSDIAAAGLSTRIRLVSAVEDLDPYWSETAVVLHAPREDPAPLVVIEAAARGLPIVTWDTGGAADLLIGAGHPELVAPAGDVIGLARRVSRLLVDPAEQHRVGQALRRTVEPLAVTVQGPLAWNAITTGTTPTR
jgi:glycosyltransferase involved in cell wall biosynthesis